MGINVTLRALADPIRREILNLLKSGRMSAGEICEHFDVTGASISRHLSVLKEADLIRDTREGKFIYYELNASVLEEIMLWIAELKGSCAVAKLLGVFDVCPFFQRMRHASLFVRHGHVSRSEESYGGEKSKIIAEGKAGESTRLTAHCSAKSAVQGAVQLVFSDLQLGNIRFYISEHNFISCISDDFQNF